MSNLPYVYISILDGFVSYVIRPFYVVVLRWTIQTCTYLRARAKELEARAFCHLENFYCGKIRN